MDSSNASIEAPAASYLQVVGYKDQICGVLAHEDALTVRVFHPNEPETPIGEHGIDLSLATENGETTVETHVEADPTTSDEIALG